MNRPHAPRWLRNVGIVLALLVVIGAGILFFAGIRPGDVANLVAEGPVQQLRDELRPATLSNGRVLVFAIDGVGEDEFRAALRSGRMPAVSALLGEPVAAETFAHGYIADGALSILPSMTYAAWTSVFTGEPAGRSGVPGNEWFDRRTGRFVAPGPVSVREHRDALAVYSESLMDEWVAVPTLFERANVRSYATLVAQHRGADILVRPDAALLRDLVAAVAAGVSPDEASDQEKYGSLDRTAAENTVSAIDEFGLPDLQVVYFPGIDLYTHVATPALGEQVDYLHDVLDPAIGHILDAYRDRDALETTYVLFVSDHGHTPTLDEERYALGAGDGGELPEVLERAGFRVRPLELETGEEDFQAVLAYQGAFAFLYLADRSTCPDAGDRCDWTRPPRREADLLPALEAIERASSDSGETKLTGAIDLLLARPTESIEAPVPFQLWTDGDLMPVGEYLQGTPRPDLLDFERRLDDLSRGPYGHRAGDVLVLARYRMDDPPERRFYFSAPYRSWHGSPNAQDSRITWMIARPDREGALLRERVRALAGGTPSQLDITPVILDLLARGGDERQ